MLSDLIKANMNLNVNQANQVIDVSSVENVIVKEKLLLLFPSWTIFCHSLDLPFKLDPRSQLVAKAFSQSIISPEPYDLEYTLGT